MSRKSNDLYEDHLPKQRVKDLLEEESINDDDILITVEGEPYENLGYYKEK